MFGWESPAKEVYSLLTVDDMYGLCLYWLATVAMWFRANND